MHVMGYTVLQEEKLPNFLKDKPQWMTCMAFAAAILMITTAAVTCGIVIGYTYCYVEHRAGAGPASSENIRSATLKIVQMPVKEPEETKYNRTINGALTNSVIANILMFSSVLLHDDPSLLMPMGKAGNDTRVLDAL